MTKFDSYAQGTPCYVELTTPDQQGSKAFYASLFGWEVAEMPVDDEGGYYVTAAVQGDAVCGIGGQPPALSGHPAFWSVYLAVDDVDAATAKVAPAGGTVEAGPFDVMELGRMSAIQDPTGARVSLWQARNHVGTVRANEPGTPIWHELTTPDVPAASAFYADVVGLAAETVPMEGGDYTTFNVEGRMVGGAMAPPMPDIPPNWGVYFNVDSVDDTVAAAQGLGAKVAAPAFDVPGVGRMAVLIDPQGGYFNLMENPPTSD
ncbi:VOC family protein [Nocardioides sp.]|uniref:VOC family protein n=1 Tax=Nocardioides sp. TaxID=35761 RepID=UPI003D13460C